MALFESVASYVAIVGVGLVLARFLFSYVTSPLKSLPGPFVAKFTDLWRFYDYWCCTQIKSHQTLHKKHGAAVRIGPNMVSLSDPDLLKQVYSTRGDFLKSNFYEVADASSQGQRLENVFSTRSNVFHARYLKPYQKFFSMNTILEKEHLADNIVRSFCQQLETRFVSKKYAFDLADWIEFAAWDLDWEMTFSQDMGFLRSGTDVDGMIHTGEMIMRYLGCVGQIPWLDRLLGKNPYCPIKFASFESAAYYSFQRVMERVNNKDAKGNGDFLDNFLEAKESHPEIVGDNEVVSYLMMNVLAGADTTAIVTKAIVWYCLSTPGVQEKLAEELSAAQLTFPCKYAETKDLPYLGACIREGMRMHPVISGILERVVPSGGMTLPDGRFIAPGTKVGINPWVSSRNDEIFGAGADSFKPERWMRGADETEEKFDARMKKMNAADFTFGSGNRQCTGRNMATVELHKIISTIFSRYEIKLDMGGGQWSPRWWWFTFIDNIKVKFTRRPGTVDITA